MNPLNKPLLVRTPAQHPEESTWGYLLRLSSVNGYPRPAEILKLAGMAKSEFNGLKMHCTKLRMVLGESGSSLRPYASEEDGTVSLQAVSNLAAYELFVSAGRVCAGCVKELGYMPAWMDLRIIDACPFHKTFLLTACSTCQRKLGLHRPSLLACTCGADLSDQHCEEASDEHCRLISWLVELVRGDSDGPASLPLPGLPPMTLTRVLGLCAGLSALHSRVSLERHPSIAQRAARMLHDWPQNLHRMIDVLAAGANAETTHGAMLLRRHAAATYKHLFKRVTEAQDVAALLEILASHVPGDLANAKSALEIGGARREASLRDDARGRPAPVKVKPASAVAVGSLDSRKAAARLGIPVVVLKYLRRTGHFEAKNAASRSVAFSVADVEAFERKVSELPTLGSFEGIAITVERALVRGAKGDAKGIFAAAVLDGSIPIVGRTGASLWDLLVDSQQAEHLRQSLRRANFGGTLSCSEAGALLGLTPTGVASACRLGILGSYKCIAGFRVYEEALAEFKANFARLAEIAREVGTGPKWAAIAAEQLGVELFRDAIRPTKNVFIRRRDMALVVEYFNNSARGPGQFKGLRVGSAAELIPDAKTVESLIIRGLFVPRGGRKKRKKDISDKSSVG